MEFLKESWEKLVDKDEDEDSIEIASPDTSKRTSIRKVYSTTTHKSKYKTRSKTGNSKHSR